MTILLALVVIFLIGYVIFNRCSPGDDTPGIAIMGISALALLVALMALFVLRADGGDLVNRHQKIQAKHELASRLMRNSSPEVANQVHAAINMALEEDVLRVHSGVKWAREWNNSLIDIWVSDALANLDPIVYDPFWHIEMLVAPQPKAD